MAEEFDDTDDADSDTPERQLVLEFALERMRARVDSEGGGFHRPRVAIWVEAHSGVIVEMAVLAPSGDYVPDILRSLETVRDRIGGLPPFIHLRDTKLAPALREILEPHGVKVLVREALPALDEALASVLEFKKISGPPEPAVVDVRGMTIDDMAEFAEAAQIFVEARPWLRMASEDLIAVESPSGPPGTACLQVLGAGGQTYGLGFFASKAAMTALHSTSKIPRDGIWALNFGSLDALPFGDGQAWERHSLPVAGENWHPWFCRFLGRAGYGLPTREQLRWAEGLLRALAATTDDDLDQGRWAKAVKVSGGTVTYRFSMPDLLEEMAQAEADAAAPPPADAMELVRQAIARRAARGIQITPAAMSRIIESANRKIDAPLPQTDIERARALCEQAYESSGRRGMQLVRQALALDPDCVEALQLQAERLVSDPEATVPVLERAVDAARRRLGPMFDEAVGNFWMIAETRPYMQVRRDLAITLIEVGRIAEAADHARDLLRLNPGDNQGNRYLLCDGLFALDQLDELDRLMNQPPGDDEISVQYAFGRALLAFKRLGDSEESRRALEQAAVENPFVAPFLTGKRQPPPASDTYSPGSEEEAGFYVDTFAHHWLNTPGAVEWVMKTIRKPKPAARKKTVKKKKK